MNIGKLLKQLTAQLIVNLVMDEISVVCVSTGAISLIPQPHLTWTINFHCHSHALITIGTWACSTGKLETAAWEIKSF